MDIFQAKDTSKPSKSNLEDDAVAKLLMQFLRYSKINKIYNHNLDKKGVDFINSLCRELDIRYEVKNEELKRIPDKGPLIIVSNHPLAGIDDILLIKIISEIRSDLKIFTNHQLGSLEPISDFIIPDTSNTQGTEDNIQYSTIKTALQHLKREGSLGFFPAREISLYNPDKNIITDRHWDDRIIKFIKHARVPVICVHFKASKNYPHQILGRIHPVLRFLRVHRNVIQKHKIIKINIGNPISVREQDQFTDVSRFGRFLRIKTYFIGTSHEVKKFFKAKLKRIKKIEPVIAQPAIESLRGEIKLLSRDHLLFKTKNYQVICAPSIIMPNVLTEIGRLREITFRDVGEGTNRNIDLDEYDLYYHQLIIWDERKEKIVGAYRLGKGKEIIDQFGIKGFYVRSLFKVNKKFLPVMQESIELGRSFIVKEYQKEPLSLFLLWKGILYFLINNPEYRYLIGPVSISNRYSTLSKALIVEFIKTNFYNYEYAQYIEPRKQFKIEFNKYIEKEVILEYAENDMKKIDKFIKDVEPYYSMPVLLKKYLNQNAKIIGFNVDPKFNNCLDGLMILDLFDVPNETIESMTKELEDESILERLILKAGVK